MKWRFATARRSTAEKQIDVGALGCPWLDFIDELIKVKYVTFEVNRDGAPLKENLRRHKKSSWRVINQLDEKQIWQIRICSYFAVVTSR